MTRSTLATNTGISSRRLPDDWMGCVYLIQSPEKSCGTLINVQPASTHTDLRKLACGLEVVGCSSHSSSLLQRYNRPATAVRGSTPSSTHTDLGKLACGLEVVRCSSHSSSLFLSVIDLPRQSGAALLQASMHAHFSPNIFKCLHGSIIITYLKCSQLTCSLFCFSFAGTPNERLLGEHYKT